MQIETPIKRIREERGLTQEQLAWQAGVSVATVSRAERSKHETDANTLNKLAKALGVEARDLRQTRGS